MTSYHYVAGYQHFRETEPVFRVNSALKLEAAGV